MTLYVVIYALFGILSMALLTHILWYPQFMLGAAEDRIQSVRAREVAGEFVPEKSTAGKVLVRFVGLIRLLSEIKMGVFRYLARNVMGMARQVRHVPNVKQ